MDELKRRILPLTILFDAYRIPAECFEYRLGNSSVVEWVIGQYQVSTDKRSGITSDPNRADDEEYVVRLVGRVVTVSVETVKLVKALPRVVIADQ